MKNGFKELEAEALQNMPAPTILAQEKIISQLGNYRTWTTIVDHFVSSPIQLIRKMLEKDVRPESMGKIDPPSQV